MTVTQSMVLQPPQPSVMVCAILSVVVHAGLLAGLGFMSQSTPTMKSVPVVQISLVPTETETPSVSPAPPPPSLRSPSRSMKTPVPARPPASPLRPAPHVSSIATLEPVPPKESQQIQRDPSEKKVFKDQHATNALVARTLMKMSKPQKAPSQTLSPPPPSPPKLTSDHRHSTTAAVPDPTSEFAEAPAPDTIPTRRRVLTARPPGGATVTSSKVGILRFVKPVYPSVAKDAGWEGTVILRVLVQTNGLPGEVGVQKSTGHAILDKAAIEAVRQWRFKPEKDGNIPVSKTVDIPLKFELHKKEHQG